MVDLKIFVILPSSFVRLISSPNITDCSFLPLNKMPLSGQFDSLQVPCLILLFRIDIQLNTRGGIFIQIFNKIRITAAYSCTRY